MIEEMFRLLQSDIAIDNLLKHGINNGFILMDVVFSRVPFVSYHYQVCFLPPNRESPSCCT